MKLSSNVMVQCMWLRNAVADSGWLKMTEEANVNLRRL